MSFYVKIPRKKKFKFEIKSNIKTVIFCTDRKNSRRPSLTVRCEFHGRRIRETRVMPPVRLSRSPITSGELTSAGKTKGIEYLLRIFAEIFEESPH
ncbi:unnamed protein product, partial [Nesidiocoris tenuis]